MKIGVAHIIRAHILTLKDKNTGYLTKSDIMLFFVIPIMLAAVLPFTSIQTGKDFYNVSITFFGIFIALLLNIQVAIFSIFQRKWDKTGNTIEDSATDEKLLQRKDLLRELNVNVSYLITVSCIALVIFVVFFGLNLNGWASVAVSSLIYAHFMLTLLMVVKRTYALFQGEYDVAA